MAAVTRVRGSDILFIFKNALQTSINKNEHSNILMASVRKLTQLNFTILDNRLWTSGKQLVKNMDRYNCHLRRLLSLYVLIKYIPLPRLAQWLYNHLLCRKILYVYYLYVPPCHLQNWTLYPICLILWYYLRFLVHVITTGLSKPLLDSTIWFINQTIQVPL